MAKLLARDRAALRLRGPPLVRAQGARSSPRTSARRACARCSTSATPSATPSRPATGYGAWLHGEAVAAGMVMAAELSRARWVADAERKLRACATLIAARRACRLAAPALAPRALHRADGARQEGARAARRASCARSASAAPRCVAMSTDGAGATKPSPLQRSKPCSVRTTKVYSKFARPFCAVQ